MTEFHGEEHSIQSSVGVSPQEKAGRVLHPEQNRLLSVREWARSQGFKDTFIFVGSIIAKYKQIGKAVPTSLAKVIGIQIKKAIIVKDMLVQGNVSRNKQRSSKNMNQIMFVKIIYKRLKMFHFVY